MTEHDPSTFKVLDFVPELVHGKSASPAEGGCIMQITDYLWSGDWTDEPECVDLHLRRLAIEINDDVCAEARQGLMRAVPALSGTAGTFKPETGAVLAVYANETFPFRHLIDPETGGYYGNPIGTDVSCQCDQWSHPGRWTLITDSVLSRLMDLYQHGVIGREGRLHNDVQIVQWLVGFVEKWRALNDADPEDIPLERWRALAEAMTAAPEVEHSA